MGESIIKEKILSGELVLYHDYRFGTYADLSKNDNGAIVKSNISPDSRGTRFRNNDGYIQVNDSPELQGDEWTLFAIGNFLRLERASDATSGRIISKRDAGGTQFEWILDNQPRMLLYDGTATKTISLNYIGARSLGIIFKSTEIPIGYKNGLKVGDFDGSVTITVNDAPIYIGNWYSASRSILNIIQAILMFNKKLDGHEMARLHGELMEIDPG